MDSFRKHITESTIPELYDSTVAAFPRTTMRQHATQPIVIKNLHWTPYKGVKTLFVKGLSQNEGREYNSLALFKGMNYHSDGEVKLMASDGKQYEFDPISLEETEVVVRCNCPAFHWRFNYYNHLDGSLYGRKRTKYESKGVTPANPQEMPGMCKHIIKLFEVLSKSGVIQ